MAAALHQLQLKYATHVRSLLYALQGHFSGSVWLYLQAEGRPASSPSPVSPFEMEISEIAISHTEIGSGSFGTVFRGRWRGTAGQPCTLCKSLHSVVIAVG